MYEVVIKNLNWDDAEFYTTFLKEEFEDDIDLEVRQIQTAENFLNEVDEVNALCGSEDVVENYKKLKESYKKFKEGFDEEGCKDCPDYGECYGEPDLLKDEEDDCFLNDDEELREVKVVINKSKKDENMKAASNKKPEETEEATFGANELIEAYAQLTPEEKKTAQDFMKYLDYMFNG